MPDAPIEQDRIAIPHVGPKQRGGRINGARNLEDAVIRDRVALFAQSLQHLLH
jgi:hypothetical protein